MYLLRRRLATASVSSVYVNHARSSSNASGGISSSNLGNGLLRWTRSGISSSSIPLADVVVIGWLGSRTRNLEKISRAWFEVHPELKNVYTYQPSVFDVLHHPRGSASASRLVLDTYDKVDYTSASSRPPIIIHGFSTGGYLYCLMANFLQTLNAEDRPRIAGCVFDSPVDVEGISDGIARALFHQPQLEYMTSRFLAGLIAAGGEGFTRPHRAASKLFRCPPIPLRAPVLCLASETDRIASADIIRDVAQHWKKNEVDFKLKMWSTGHHVALFKAAPQEYLAELKEFFHQKVLPK